MSLVYIKRSGVALWALLIMCFGTEAQNPDWSVDYSQFQYRMTISAVLEHDGEWLEQGENKVAAFIDGEICGLGYAESLHQPTGQYLAIFQVGSHTATGGEITFRVYDEAENQVFEARKKEGFDADFLLGSVTAPYIISDNRYPSEVTISSAAFEENLASGVLVSDIEVLDEDDDEHVFILSGFDPVEAEDWIRISGSQIVSKQPANFEVYSSFQVDISAADSLGGSVSRTLSFSISNVPEAPEDIVLSNPYILENSAKATLVGTLSTVDDDLNDQHTYEILPAVGSEDASYFKLVDDQLVTDQSIDKESQDSYRISVRTTDTQGFTFERDLVIYVVDENEKPIANDTAWVVGEDLSVGSLIGQIKAQDPDEAQTLSYELAEAGTVPFDLDASNGNLSLSASLDYESRTNYYLSVSVTDDGLPALKEVVSVRVQLTDVNEAPTDILLSAATIMENRNAGSIIGLLETIDPDQVDFFSYELLSVDGNASSQAFLIQENKLLSNRSFDFEQSDTHTLEVLSVDKEGLTVIKLLDISIEDRNEAPVLADTTFRIEENVEVDHVIGDLLAYDQDFGQQLSFSILGGSEIMAVSLDGRLTVLSSEALDYEETPELSLSVIVQDNGNPVLADTCRVQVVLIDMPEAELPIRNYLSPNGDGINDFLTIDNPEIYEGYTLKVINPRGKEVYYSDSYDNSWDGRAHGDVLPDGVYYYIFENTERNSRYEGPLYIKSR